jgi:hypothetical protein
MTANDELGKMWSLPLLRHCPEGTEEKHEPESG